MLAEALYIGSIGGEIALRNSEAYNFVSISGYITNEGVPIFDTPSLLGLVRLAVATLSRDLLIATAIAAIAAAAGVRSAARVSGVVGAAGAGSRVHDAVDGVLGSLRPTEGGVAVQLLTSEFACGLGQQLHALYGILSLFRVVRRAVGAVGVLRGRQATKTGIDLVVLAEQQAVSLDGTLEDGQVVDLHGVAIETYLTGTGHEVLQDTCDGTF